MSFRLLGNISGILLLFQILPFVLNFVNRKLIKSKSPEFRTLMKWLRKIHKYTGALLLITALIHGFMAFGTIRFHTGSVLYVMVILTAASGLGFHKKKKKRILQMHRFLAGVMFLFFLLHYFFPGALSSLF